MQQLNLMICDCLGVTLRKAVAVVETTSIIEKITATGKPTLMPVFGNFPPESRAAAAV